MKDEKLLKAFHRWEELSLSEEEYIAYEGRLKHILDEEALVGEAKLREQEAYDEGILLGKRQTAINLLKMNVPVEQIVKATTLSIEEIIKLKSSNETS